VIKLYFISVYIYFILADGHDNTQSLSDFHQRKIKGACHVMGGRDGLTKIINPAHAYYNVTMLIIIITSVEVNFSMLLYELVKDRFK